MSGDHGIISWHRRGQLIVCKNARKLPDHFPPLVRKMVYRIADVSADCGSPHFALEEITDISPKSGDRFRYAAKRFRPIEYLRTENFDSLLNPTPEQIQKFLSEEDDGVKERKKVREEV